MNYAFRWAFLIIALTGLGFGLAKRFHFAPVSNPTDFRAFYCGGSVVLAHGDPYTVEPLRSCQDGVLRSQRLAWIPKLVVPAPLPPYALALFGALAWLPFEPASALWCSITIAAWLRTALLLRTLTGLPFANVTIATFGLGLFVSFNYGQIVPVALWTIVEAAVYLHAGKMRAAALFATAALIEPQLGGPVFLAVAILRPRARVPLALGLATLGLVAFAVAGPAECLEWFVRVLPAQGRSELRNPEQFGLSTLLSYLGCSPAIAAVGGSLSYTVIVAAGIWTASRIEKSWPDAAVIALIPAAFSAVGGPYVHEHQLAAVIPIALLGYARTAKPAYVVSFGLLSCPWLSLAESYGPLHDVFWPWHRIAIGYVAPSALAEAIWSQFMATIAPTPQAIGIVTLVKLPLWIGIAFAVVPLLREASSGRAPRAALVTSNAK